MPRAVRDQPLPNLIQEANLPSEWSLTIRYPALELLTAGGVYLSVLANYLRYVTGIMKRSLVAIVALWAILLGPGLCLAGALDHLCSDCTEQMACGHEDRCAEDPCTETLLRPDTGVNDREPTPPPAVNSGFASGPPRAFQHSRNSAELPPTSRKNLPRPESDLPLRI